MPECPRFFFFFFFLKRNPPEKLALPSSVCDLCQLKHSVYEEIRKQKFDHLTESRPNYDRKTLERVQRRLIWGEIDVRGVNGTSNETVAEVNREDTRAPALTAAVMQWRNKQRALLRCREQNLLSHPDFLPDPPTLLLACACAPRALRSQPVPRVTVAPATSRLRQVIHALRIRSGRCQPEPTGCRLAWTVGSVRAVLLLLLLLLPSSSSVT